jgi:tryptophan synthase alpha chain
MLLVNDGPIHAKFQQLKNQHESALIAYLTGGDPDTRSFIANCKAVIDAGADVLEIGMPFSDPIADGPIIQTSSSRALAQGVTFDRIFYAVQRILSYKKVPIVILTYYNPILALGVETFLSKCQHVGVNGVVIPDLPVGEEDYFSEIASKYNVDKICLAAPNTSLSRLRKIVEQSKGFLYLVSLYGVTGPRDHLSPEAIETLRRVKTIVASKIPICAGFGISQSTHVASLVRSGADGVIVGSALVRIVSEHLNEPSETPSHLRQTISELKAATKHNYSQ